jgi:hypothetical protein
VRRHHRACVFDGAINGERFRAYVEQMLAAILLHSRLSRVAGTEQRRPRFYVYRQQQDQPE